MKHVLPTLIDSARDQRDQLAAAASAAAAAHQRAADTLAQLDRFRVEYLGRSPAVRGGSCDAQALADFQQFVARLDQAISIQRYECQRHSENLAAWQQRLAEGQRKLMAFEKLQQREADAHAQVMQRRAQRETDEFAARSARHAESRL